MSREFKRGDRVRIVRAAWTDGGRSNVHVVEGAVMTVDRIEDEDGDIWVTNEEGRSGYVGACNVERVVEETPEPAKTKLYLAGPMRGLPAFNFPAFHAAAARLRAAGYDVFSPAEHDEEGGFDSSGYDGTEDLSGIGFDLRAALGADLAYVTGKADGIAVLPGWENSKGTKAEVATAEALGLPVWTVEEWQMLEDGFEEWELELLRPVDAEIVPASGEVRVTSATGGAKGVKPARFEFLPTDSLFELAEHYGKGAAKYPSPEGRPGLDNWRAGYPWSQSFGAALRHLFSAMGGQDIDPETGSKEVIAVAWHMLTLAHWMNNPELREQFDDRQAVLEARGVTV